jgi:hypothetical protein
MVNVKLDLYVYGCLKEAFRRFECFANRPWTIENIQKAMTGLGLPSDYQQAVTQGYMTPLNGKMNGEKKGKKWIEHETWFLLTENGAKIILDWHTAGFKCKEYEAPAVPRNIKI